MTIFVIGAGFTGMQLAKMLVLERNKVVLIDNDAEKVRHASDALDCTVIEADGNSIDVLEQAGIASANAFVALTGDDEVNMIACQIVDSAYPDILKIARVRNYAYYSAVDSASRRKRTSSKDTVRAMYGMDAMINPDVEAASAIHRAVEYGAVGNIIDLKNDFMLTTLSVGSDSVLVGRCMRELPGIDGWDFLVAFAEPETGALIPRGDTVINANNTWLPPTSSAITHLDKGTHKVFVSGSRGDKPSVGIRKVTDITTFSSPVAVALDYTVFAGNADQIISSYRNLTGKVPAMPDWAFGYIHCRERYDSQKELLENAHRLKDEGYHTSVIVQDWQWWGKYGWNAMQFDEGKYPDPKAMTDELHSMDMKLMLSVWSKIDKNSEVGRQMNAAGYYIAGTDWIDFFNPDAAAAYWKNFSERLLPTGIDAWWQDATEPENDDLKGRMVAGGKIPGEFYRNAYPNMVNHTVYNGLINDQPDRDPMILTRSGYIGIQRYGAINWSGDVGNDWETLRRQIAGGLNLMATGQPWWTYDAGGFFRPNNQYTDAAYQERMMRWIQTAVFLPFMRVHGYMSRTEPWNYSEETQANFHKQIELRDRLQPYILDCAKKVSEDNYTMMRPLVFDFPADEEALRQDCEFML